MTVIRTTLAAALLAGLGPMAAAAQESGPSNEKPQGTSGAAAAVTAEPTGSCAFTPAGGLPHCLNGLSQGACRATGMEAGTAVTWQAGRTCP